MKLSYSSMKTYQECPKKWEYHYRSGLRAATQGAALCFGTAIDKAATQMLTTSYDDAVVAFHKNWISQEVQRKLWDLSMHPQLRYADSDFDHELLSDLDWTTLELTHETVNPKERMEYLYTVKKDTGYDSFTIDELKFFNHANWMCLKQKGLLMLVAMRDELLPNIEGVYSLQEKTELANGAGDSVVGYVDLVIKWKGIEEPIIADIKTSSILYGKDAVMMSPQLATYTYMLAEKYKTRKAAFFVFNKHIHKNKTKTCKQCSNDGTGKSHRTCDAILDTGRCKGEWNITLNPKVSIQILINDIPPRTENIVLGNMEIINSAIKAELFYRNFDNCVKPYGKCVYYDLCFKDDKTNLIETKEFP